MLHQSNPFVSVHQNDVLGRKTRILPEGWSPLSSITTTSRVTVKEPVIAVPISTPFNCHKNTTQVSSISLASPASALVLSSEIQCSMPLMTSTSTEQTKTSLRINTTMTTMEDDGEWVGIEKDYWVIDGELIEEDLYNEAQYSGKSAAPVSFSVFCQKFQDWMKMKRVKCRYKKQQQQPQQQKDIYPHHTMKTKRHNRKMTKFTDDSQSSSTADMSSLVHNPNTTKLYYYQDQRQHKQAIHQPLYEQQQEQQYSIRMIQRPSFSNCSPINDTTRRTIFPSINNDNNKVYSSSPLFMIEDDKENRNKLVFQREDDKISKNYALSDNASRTQASQEEETNHQHSVTVKLLKIKEYILSSNILLQIKLQRELHPQFYTKNDVSNTNNNPYAFYSNYYCPIISKQDIYIFLSTCRQEDNIIVQELLSCGCGKLSSLHDLVEHLCQVLVKNRVLYGITSHVFYIPSLLHHQDYDVLMDDDLRCHASTVWSYKCIESWKVTLCHSWTFQADNGNTMQDIDFMSIVISGIFAKFDPHSNTTTENDVNETINIRHASCWKNACYLILTSPITASPQAAVSAEDSGISSTNLRENVVELFLHWVDTTHAHSVSSSNTNEYKELRVSAKGQCGIHGKRIYQGGYKLILSAIDDIIHNDKLLQTLIFTKEIICPECLAMNSISRSSLFDYNHVIQAEHCGMHSDCNTIICDYGHSIDTRILTGTQRKKSKHSTKNNISHGSDNHTHDYTIASHTSKHIHSLQANPLSLSTRWSSQSPYTDSPAASPLTKSFSTISRAVVLVGLWSPKEKRLISVGSGFIVDKKLGLIITAAHTLIHMGGGNKTQNAIGEDYYGCKHGKAVIGVIPPSSQQQQGFTSKKNKIPFHTALFRYSAEIIAKDIQNVDACILRITTKFDHDIPIQNQGEDIGNISAETPLRNNESLLRKEQLQSLPVTYDFEIQEQIRIVGYNQGGEGLIHEGMWVGGCLDFAFGYICKHFRTNDKLLNSRTTNSDGENNNNIIQPQPNNKDRRVKNANIIRNPFFTTYSSNNNHRNINSASTVFYPKQEIVMICPTITGHSGGPCVNANGEVIGILSRVDSVDSDRCYIVPACEWKPLLKRAKKNM